MGFAVEQENDLGDMRSARGFILQLVYGLSLLFSDTWCKYMAYVIIGNGTIER